MKKQIEGFPGYYIEEDGRVWSEKTHKYLTLQTTSLGYLYVNLRDADKKQRLKLIHRLVAEAFIPNPENLKEVNHKDEDKTNNTVANLEWCTREYNINYGSRNRQTSRAIGMYDKNTEQLIRSFDSVSDAAKFLNKYESRSTLSKCANGKLNSAFGYKWKYIDPGENL